MRIKSYYAHTVEDAMSMARQELGADAMLVNTRKASFEARHLGEYEVVFATELPLEEGADAPRSGAAPTPAHQAGSLAREVADLKKELEGMRRALQRSAFAPAQWAGASPDEAGAFATLTASDLDPDMARGIVEAAQARLHSQVAGVQAPRADAGAFQRALIEELDSRFTVQAALGRGEATPRIVALVGPPGAGKTTTLVKLAVNYGLACRRPVLLLSMDNYRVAAAEQLRSYAAILGVGFQFLETVTALAQTIEENRGKDLILIDTPGFAFPDMDMADGLGHFLATRDDLDTQLVLPASMKSGDLSRVVEQFGIFRPHRLLFTKLDETGSFGPILQEASRSGRPLSFFTTGQRIPEDLEAAAKGRLLELVLSGRRPEALSAA